MKEDLIKEVGNKLDELNVYIYDVYEEKDFESLNYKGRALCLRENGMNGY